MFRVGETPTSVEIEREERKRFNSVNRPSILPGSDRPSVSHGAEEEDYSDESVEQGTYGKTSKSKSTKKSKPQPKYENQLDKLQQVATSLTPK